MGNWAAWLWDGPSPIPRRPPRAASVEGRYVAPSDMGADDSLARIIPIDAAAAEVVERAYRRSLSPAEQRAVAAEWPRRHQSGRAAFGRAGAARRLRMPLAAYEQALSRAARLVTEAMQRTGRWPA